MPKPAKGTLYWTDDGPVARITLKGRERPTYKLPTCRTEKEAEDRRDLLSSMAQRFRKAGLIDNADALRLLDMAASSPAAMLPGVLTVAGELIGGELTDKSVQAPPTFRKVGEAWTSGEMHKRFPDRVDVVKSNDTNAKRLEKAIYPLLGARRIDQVTRADCDRVMQLLPPPPGKTELSRETRRQYGVLINRVLNLAELAGHIERNPLPRGWVPKGTPKKQRKRFPILYPGEDRTLLACETIPLCFRLLYGFLHREGPRRSEAAAMQFADFDFENETVSLDENKTNHPRWWRLGPGVAAALEAWRDKREAGPDDFVFIDENGGPLNLDHLAERVRGHLEDAGLSRADLYSQGPNKAWFGTHCFRRSYVTRELGNGRSEDHIRRRTGHESDELYRYRQQAHELAALDLGDVEPLDQAIEPDGDDCPRIAHQIVGAAGFEPATPRPPAVSAEAEKPNDAESLSATAPSSDEQSRPVGNQAADLGNGRYKLAGLEAMRKAAAAAEDWLAVAELSKQIDELTANAATVIDLAKAKAKRGR